MEKTLLKHVVRKVEVNLLLRLVQNNFIETYSKKYRLTTSNDFQNLKSGSRFLVSGLVVCYFKKRSDQKSNSRLGIAASKKFGNAVARNKFKRKSREAFRRSEFKESGFDILVSPNLKHIKSSKLTTDEYFDELGESLESLFKSKFA